MLDDRRMFLSQCGITVAGLGMAATGLADLMEIRRPFCSVRDEYNMNASILPKKWDRTNFRYVIASRDTDLPREIWDEEFKKAFDCWSEITPLKFEQVGYRKEYDIIIMVSGRRREGFGRSGGTLAWAELPPSRNFDGVLVSKFDSAESWVLPQEPDYGTVLRTVAAHEIGHLLGLDHSNDEDALMFPYINDALKPREDDIAKIQRLYGSNI